ncbi:MAG: hypothetical protein LBP59_08985 [Planctomycetaceae bacterium]|nr:hypothetical protein [Planctomycetaceae bacterium]
MYSTAVERGYIKTAFLFALRQIAVGTVVILLNFLLKKIVTLVHQKIINTYFAKQIFVNGYKIINL